jgi:hypothetical protein
VQRHDGIAYHANEPLILHLLNGNIIHQARDNGARPGLLAEVDLLENFILVEVLHTTLAACLDIKTIGIRMLFDCSTVNQCGGRIDV